MLLVALSLSFFAPGGALSASAGLTAAPALPGHTTSPAADTGSIGGSIGGSLQDPSEDPTDRDQADPAKQAEQAEPAKPEWFEGSFEELLEKAAQEDRPVFLHFWAGWSRRSQVLYAKYQEDEIAAALGGYLAYTIDVMSPEGKPLAERYAAVRPPRMLFLSPSGEVIDLLGDITEPEWMTSEELLSEIERVRAGRGTIPALRAHLEQQPEDLTTRFELALKLRGSGNEPAFHQQVARLRELDPEGRSLPLRTLELEKIQKDLQEPRHAPPRKQQTAEALRAFIESQPDDALLFDAWMALATYYSQSAIDAKRRYEHDKARELAPEYVACWRQALEYASEKEFALLGPYVGITIFELRDYLKEPAKEFALEITTTLMEAKPDDVDLMDAHACSLYMNGRRDEAIALLQRAKQIDPSNWILQERVKMFL